MKRVSDRTVPYLPNVALFMAIKTGKNTQISNASNRP